MDFFHTRIFLIIIIIYQNAERKNEPSTVHTDDDWRVTVDKKPKIKFENETERIMIIKKNKNTSTIFRSVEKKFRKQIDFVCKCSRDEKKQTNIQSKWFLLLLLYIFFPSTWTPCISSSQVLLTYLRIDFHSLSGLTDFLFSCVMSVFCFCFWFYTCLWCISFRLLCSSQKIAMITYFQFSLVLFWFHILCCIIFLLLRKAKKSTHHFQGRSRISLFLYYSLVDRSKDAWICMCNNFYHIIWCDYFVSCIGIGNWYIYSDDAMLKRIQYAIMAFVM